jgi:solute carrier family 25 protein 34/35
MLVKHVGMEEGTPLHLTSSTASGFAVCCVMHPPGKSSLMGLGRGLCIVRRITDICKLDTIMSRMYNQTGNLYSGVADCLVKTIKTEGVFAIYKGFFAHLARILPHTVSKHYGLRIENVAD